MTRKHGLALAVGMMLLASVAFVAAEDHKEVVSNGEVTAVSVPNRTITVSEIADPKSDAKPGAMQSGVVREFTITDDTKFMSSQNQAGTLANIRVGDRVTIHYTLGTGKNVAIRITQGIPSTE